MQSNTTATKHHITITKKINSIRTFSVCQKKIMNDYMETSQSLCWWTFVVKNYAQCKSKLYTTLVHHKIGNNMDKSLILTAGLMSSFVHHNAFQPLET